MEIWQHLNTDDFLKHFNVVSQGVDKYGYNCYKAICPCCAARGKGDDQKGHLKLTEKHDGTFMCYCIRCDAKGSDIMDAIGKKMNFLYLYEGEQKPNVENVAQKNYTNVSTVVPVVNAQQRKKPFIAVQERRHTYYNVDGSIYGYKVIKKDADGNKQAYWLNKNGALGREGTPPLYNANSITQLWYVFIVEGEKDADTLQKLGWNATTLPDGANTRKWLPMYDELLKGKTIYIITDNDDVGVEYGERVKEHCCNVSNDVYLIQAKDILPDVKAKGDITDIYDTVGDVETQSLIIKTITQANTNKGHNNV